jgi:glycerophosphoryl diester phosphodiesterase
MQIKAAQVLACLVPLLASVGCSTVTSPSGHTRVVAHRGASGYLPEHTLEAYAAAYFMGADLIEPDVVSTRDGQLICLHDLYLEKVTDVVSRFPERSREDGHWFAIDFDLEEIQQLRVTGRDGQDWDGFQIATLEQMLALVRGLNAQTGRQVGVVPEIKDPGFHRRSGVDLASALVSMIERTGWENRECIIQCFDPQTLREMHAQYGDRFTLLQLISDLEKVPSLREIATYASGIGPSRKVIDADPSIVTQAHALGLVVVPYTFKEDHQAIEHYAEQLKVDALFANYPDIARQIVHER